MGRARETTGLRWIAAGLIATLAAGAATAQERTLTLDEALDTALRHHPGLAASQYAIDAAREGEGVAFAGFLPTLDFDASYTRATGNQVPTPGALFSTATSRSTKSYNFFQFSLNLRQSIWDFGRTLGAHRATEATTEATRKDLAAARLGVWAQVVTAYHGVVAAQRMAEVALRLRDQARTLAKRARELYEAGAKPRIDVTRTEAAAQMAEAGYVASEEARNLACAVLLAAMGTRERFRFQAVAPAIPAPESPPPDLEAAVAEAMRRRPERAAFLDRLRAQEAELTRVRGDYFPRLFAFGLASEAGVEMDDLVWNWAVGVGLSYPIFSGLATRHGVRAQEARVAAIKAGLEALDLGIRSEVEQARSRVVEAAARIPPARAASAAARETMTLAEERYRLGEGNQVELLDAQAALAQSEAALIRAEYDLAVAWTALWRAVGRLPEAPAEDGLVAPGLP